MAIKYGELKKRILKKIDEYEADVDGWTDDEDIINKMPDAVNEAVRFVFYAKGHNTEWNVTQGFPVNALEKPENDPDYKPLFGEHRAEDIEYEADNVFCYYFEVDDTADIKIYKKVIDYLEEQVPLMHEVIDYETHTYTVEEPVLDPQGNPTYNIIHVLIDPEGPDESSNWATRTDFKKDEHGNYIQATDPVTGDPLYTWVYDEQGNHVLIDPEGADEESNWEKTPVWETETVYITESVQITQPVTHTEQVEVGSHEEQVIDEHGDPVYETVYTPNGYVWAPISENEVTVEHKNDQPFSNFIAYKGKVADEPMSIKIVFSGTYYYKYRNVCLHNVCYETDEKIPPYTGFRQHDIPKNLYQIVQAYRIVDGERKNVSYYTEDYKLYLPDVEGVIHLVSKFFPDPVDEETPDDYVIDIPIDTEWVVVSKAAAILTGEGEPSDFIADEEQYMQMLEGDRGRSGAPKVVRLR